MIYNWRVRRVMQETRVGRRGVYYCELLPAAGYSCHLYILAIVMCARYRYDIYVIFGESSNCMGC